MDLRRIRVLLADDHRMVAQALAALLKSSCDLVGLAEDGHALVEEATRLKPDVIVTDVFMPLLNGIDAVRQIKSRGIDSKIVFLTVHAEPKLAVEAFRAGASGFVSKQSAVEELIQAVQDAARGRVFITPLIAKDMIHVLIDDKGSASSVEPHLTPRQREVLQLIAEGKSNKEAAAVLGLSPYTVETHRTHIMQKLDLHNTAEIVLYAVRKKIIV